LTVPGSFDAVPVPVHLDRDLVALGLEFGMGGVGSILALRWIAPAARAARRPSPLSPWNGDASDLLVFLLFVLGGVFLLAGVTPFLLRHTAWSPQGRLVVMTAAFEAGLLLGIASFHFGYRRLDGGMAAQPLRTLLDGGAVFLVALPFVSAATYLWRTLLLAVGLPVGNQDSLELFASLHSGILRIVFSILAILIAPLCEELIFRLALFRFFRDRTPFWIAVVIPALLFGGAHLLQSPLENLPAFMPLVVLGILFSIAYNRTGRIGTTIVAHALFNLNTVLLVLAGVTS
jgi:membrane protease YdiL (CAAX protease family)